MKKYFLAFVVLVLTTVILLEIALRIVGIPSYKTVQLQITSQPPNAVVTSNEFGYALSDGEYKITLNEDLKFNATHDNNYRITSRFTEKNNLDSTNLDLYGCSITYGYGVDDSSAFPYLIQDHFPEFKVNNFAVPGYGTTQVYNQIKQNYEKSNSGLVIYCYGNFHLERTALTTNWQEITHSIFMQNPNLKNNQAQNCRFPYGEIQDGKLVTEYKHIKEFERVSPISLRRISSLSNLIKYKLNLENTSDLVNVTTKMLDEIKSIVESKNGELIVCFLTTQTNDPVYQYCKEYNINTINLAVPIWEKEYNNLPYDPHPNALAHQLYADSIISYIRAL